MLYCFVEGKIEQYNTETWYAYIDLISESCVKQALHVRGILKLTPYNLL